MISIVKNSSFKNNRVASLKKEYYAKNICWMFWSKDFSNDSRNPNIGISLISLMLSNWDIL